MPAVLDEPTASRAIDPVRFQVRGWVWLGDAQPRLKAIEAWSGDRLLGQSMGLSRRPDVIRALDLGEGEKPGFDFFADFPGEDPETEFELTIHARMDDGSRSAALCGARVRTTARSGQDKEPDHSPASPVASAGDEALPPDHLQIRQVGGVWGSRFFSEGRVIFNQIATVLREAGYPLEQAQRVLDFGCGCGRVLRGFVDLPNRPEVWGSDIDREAIEWNRQHLSDFATFTCNSPIPPTSFEPGYFDCAYSVSVFTHLPEELQFAWLTELRRIVRPGGWVIASTHGAHCWQHADSNARAELEHRGFAYQLSSRTDGLPDHYGTAFHSTAYVRNRWSWFFEVIAIREKYIHGLQDAVILRRRDD